MGTFTCVPHLPEQDMGKIWNKTVMHLITGEQVGTGLISYNITHITLPNWCHLFRVILSCKTKPDQMPTDFNTTRIFTGLLIYSLCSILNQITFFSWIWDMESYEQRKYFFLDLRRWNYDDCVPSNQPQFNSCPILCSLEKVSPNSSPVALFIYFHYWRVVGKNTRNKRIKIMIFIYNSSKSTLTDKHLNKNILVKVSLLYFSCY